MITRLPPLPRLSTKATKVAIPVPLLPLPCSPRSPWHADSWLFSVADDLPNRADVLDNLRDSKVASFQVNTSEATGNFVGNDPSSGCSQARRANLDQASLHLNFHCKGITDLFFQLYSYLGMNLCKMLEWNHIYLSDLLIHL